MYLDNCCFNRPFDNQTQLRINLESQAKLAVQAMILNKEHSLVWSYMLEYENEQNPYELRKDSIIKWKELATTRVEESESILTNAEKLLAVGIKPKDAIHIACAAEANCDYFLTTDKGILKKNIDLVRVVNPLDFIKEMEESE